MTLLRSFARYSQTATSDLPFILSMVDKWFMRLDLFVYDNPCFLGDVSAQDAGIIAGDVYSFENPVNLQDIFIKNYTAGSNTRVVAIGPLMNKEQGRQLGIAIA